MPQLTETVISFYSSTIFSNAGYTSDQALFASLGYGAVQVVFTIPTLFLIDTKGRRTLTLITFPLMAIFLLAAGLSLLGIRPGYGTYPVEIPASDRPARLGPVVLFVYLFTIMYSLGEGPVAFQYSAEVFPTIQREQGMAWAVCINNTFAGVLSLTFPRMNSVMTAPGACMLSPFSPRSDIAFANIAPSRLLRRSQLDSLGYDFLLRPRDQAAHPGGNRP